MRLVTLADALDTRNKRLFCSTEMRRLTMLVMLEIKKIDQILI